MRADTSPRIPDHHPEGGASPLDLNQLLAPAGIAELRREIEQGRLKRFCTGSKIPQADLGIAKHDAREGPRDLIFAARLFQRKSAQRHDAFIVVAGVRAARERNEGRCRPISELNRTGVGLISTESIADIGVAVAECFLKFRRTRIDLDRPFEPLDRLFMLPHLAEGPHPRIDLECVVLKLIRNLLRLDRWAHDRWNLLELNLVGTQQRTPVCLGARCERVGRVLE